MLFLIITIDETEDSSLTDTSAVSF